MKGRLQRIWYNAKTKKYVVEGINGAERTNLVCDTETKIVYYQFWGRDDGYMSPYIGPNGKFCKLVANEIVEIG